MGAVVLGMVWGRWFLPVSLVGHLELVTNIALGLMLVGVGIELGGKRSTWRRLRVLGWRVLLVPLAVGIGSLAGAVGAGLMLNLPFNESSAIGAGFGWYSLSGVLIAQIYDVQVGALAFLTNVIRELMAFMLIPVLAVKMSKLMAVAPGGATTMDTTLPVISRATDADTTIIALVNGTSLSLMVPLLVPLLISL